jgi:hypothetical protein
MSECASHDFVSDAVDSLKRGGHSYVLVTRNGVTGMRGMHWELPSPCDYDAVRADLEELIKEDQRG